MNYKSIKQRNWLLIHPECYIMIKLLILQMSYKCEFLMFLKSMR